MNYSNLLIKLIDLIPVLFVLLLLIGTWFPFVLLVCIPLFATYPAWSCTYLVIYHILLVLVLISYVRAALTKSEVPLNFKHNDNHEEDVSPPNNENTEIFETKYSLERKRKNSNLRFCDKCKNDKPDRSHHCSKCGKCILKMDHHCPWVNQCIGWRNYKFFMLFVTYTTLLCAFGCLALLLDAITWDWTNFGWREITLIVLFLTAAIFGATMLGFTLMHMQFVILNLTTIESFEKDRDAKFKSPYDVGYYQNWKQVFGGNILLWFLPVGNSIGDGVHFPIHKSMLLVDGESSTQEPKTPDYLV